jgi:hypothetical protein
MKATQLRIVDKVILPRTNKAYQEASISLHEIGTAKQRARLTRVHTTIEMSLNITYVDRTETSLWADIQPPGADVPQSALGSMKSQHPPKCGTQ